MFTDDSFEKKGFDAETDYDDYIDRIFTFINEKVGTEYFPSDEDEEEVARFKKDFNDEFDEVGQAIEDANDWSWNEILGAETFGAENERVCDYCEMEAKDMGMVTFPNGLAVCDMCFDEQSGELNAESYSADEGRKTSSKGIDAFAEPFEEIGISKPYARLGVIAAGITALAFGVNKLRK